MEARPSVVSIASPQRVPAASAPPPLSAVRPDQAAGLSFDHRLLRVAVLVGKDFDGVFTRRWLFYGLTGVSLKPALGWPVGVAVKTMAARPPNAL